MKRLSLIGLKVTGVGSILTICKIAVLGSVAFYGGLLLMILGLLIESRTGGTENIDINKEQNHDAH